MKLEPGEKLNEAVAKALGGIYREGTPWECWDGSPRIRLVVEWPDGSVQEWYPSMRLDHAWQVVRKLDLLIIGFDFAHEGIACRMISAKFGVVECKGETESHAICLTALAALESK